MRKSYVHVLPSTPTVTQQRRLLAFGGMDGFAYFLLTRPRSYVTSVSFKGGAYFRLNRADLSAIHSPACEAEIVYEQESERSWNVFLK